MANTSKSFLLFLVLLLLFAGPGSVSASPQLGKIEFLNSGSPDAQDDFIDGVLFMHSFEFAKARAAFLRAQKVDASFALARWGEAMTYHHSLWRKHWQEEGQQALLKLGKTESERAKKAPTKRERAYLRAAETLFGLTEQSKNRSKLERDVLYRDQMRMLYLAYPNDQEAAAFYGLSVLGVGSADREYATYMKAAAILIAVRDANREHPGATHYLIHAFDDPVHAVLALPMARAYSKIAPDSAHARHMTSHIFLALGLWDDAVEANLRAFDVESKATEGTDVCSGEECHYSYWLIYARLQQGRIADAGTLLEFMRGRLDDGPSHRERAYFGAMFARYIIDTQDWEAAATWAAPASMDIPAVHYKFARAYAAIKLGNLDAAESIIDLLKADRLDYMEISLSKEEVEILHLALKALLEQARGNGDAAVAYAMEAHDKELGRPFNFGPPRLIKPTGELLGDILLDLGRTQEATKAYQDQLERSKMRTNSLLGVSRAAQNDKTSSTSNTAYKELVQVWHNADRDFDLLEEARTVTGAVR